MGGNFNHLMMVQLKIQNNFLVRNHKKPEPTTIHYETSLLVASTLKLFGDVLEVSSHLISDDRTTLVSDPIGARQSLAHIFDPSVGRKFTLS